MYVMCASAFQNNLMNAILTSASIHKSEAMEIYTGLLDERNPKRSQLDL